MSTTAAKIALEPVVTGLNFPTTATFGPDGAMYITETGLPFGGAPVGGRVLRVSGGETEVLIDLPDSRHWRREGDATHGIPRTG
jgi:hypothetical protein